MRESFSLFFYIQNRTGEKDALSDKVIYYRAVWKSEGR